MRHHSNSFFQYISFNFGLDIVSTLKEWINLQKLIIKMRLRIKFLKNCITNNLVPTHLNRFASYADNLYHERSRRKFHYIVKRFHTSVLRNEIDDAYMRVRCSRRQVFKNAQRIYQWLPTHTCNLFFSTQCTSLHFYYTKEQRRLDGKFNWLLQKQRSFLENDIRSICYYSTVESRAEKPLRTGLRSDNLQPLKSTIESQFSFKPIAITSNTTSMRINLEPSAFIREPSLSALDIMDKWFINLSSVDVPEEVQGLLQLGDNFCLPITNSVRAVTEMIKNIEHNVRTLPMNKQIAVRNRSAPIINNLANYSVKRSSTEKTLIQATRSTRIFMRENPDIIFTRADKGNVTVALDRDSYMNKITDMLEDEKTYSVITKDPTRNVISNLHRLLVRWRDREYISDITYKRLNCTDGALPRAYGLPKIHKPGCPFRIIVSSINTPLHPLATLLHKIIHGAIPKAHSHISNSYELVQKLSGIYIDSHFKLISLDVVSLFTNIPLDMAMDSIMNRWPFIEEKCDIPKDEFLAAVRFVLNSTYFTFNGTIYQQTFGAPMGSPLSPIIADITLQDLENRAIRYIPFNLPFYYRYVDDMALAVPSSMLREVLSVFNSFHPRLQFTMEEGADNKLNFLDVVIIVNNNIIEFDWYHKPTFSGRYLNFTSNHPLCQKRGTIIGLVDRAFLLSHPRFHKKNLELVINILLDNSYPLRYIFNVIRDRLKLLFTKTVVKENKEPDEHPSYFTVPYIPKFSERMKRTVRDLNTRLSYAGLHRLSEFIKVQKDPIPKYSCNNVVYKISCKDCEASYVGQTGRQLKKRISEHRNHIHRNTTQASVITDHRLEHDHEFNWEDVEILDNEISFGKRLVSEMLCIKRQKNSLNLQSDTESLHHAFATIVEKLPLV